MSARVSQPLTVVLTTAAGEFVVGCVAYTAVKVLDLGTLVLDLGRELLLIYVTLV